MNNPVWNMGLMKRIKVRWLFPVLVAAEILPSIQPTATFAIAVAAQKTSEGKMTDQEAIGLVAISRNEVIDKAKDWLHLWRRGVIGKKLTDAQCEVLAAVVLLESREEMDAQRCRECGNTPESGACFACKMD